MVYDLFRILAYRLAVMVSDQHSNTEDSKQILDERMDETVAEYLW